MSTISANDLQNTLGGIPTVKGQRLIPTAWVNFNGTGTVAIRDSENVSSITDSGVGQYIVNFAEAMANVNFAPVTSSQTAVDFTLICNILSTTQLSVASYDSAYFDQPAVYAVVMGGQ
jgi:hypothetical protein